MKRTRKDVEERALQVLLETGAVRIPVPLELLAVRLHLDLKEMPMSDDVSGLLAIDEDGGTIAYNPRHPWVRQRFTIAHEIGHFVLHHSDDQLFIDKAYTVLKRHKHPRGADIREIEANQFAAALLMPKDLLEQEIARMEFDLGNEQALEELARRFDVSLSAMTYRIAQLGIF